MNQEHLTILIVTKNASCRGGVANYFNLFFTKVREDDLRIERFDIGSRSEDYYRRRKRRVAYCWEFISDACHFLQCLISRRDIRLVHLNPSLIPVPLLRDGILLFISKILGRKTVVFIRGWSDDIAKTICRSRWLRRLFHGVYDRADCIIVLAEDFRRQLIELGIPGEKILVSRTMFDGDLIQTRQETAGPLTRFLYLGRISREKGAFEIIEAAGKLKADGFAFKIDFHGHGATTDIIESLKARALELDVDSCINLGDFLNGEEKYRAYACSDIFLLPSHHEGCPNSVLEAMGSGCFVICTGAGAMKEVVCNGVNGLIVQIGDTEDLAARMAWAITNIDTVRLLGKENRNYAISNFESEIITKQITAIYQSLLH
jgi:glycosyltransferase involved in cell wall biosynthesis